MWLGLIYIITLIAAALVIGGLMQPTICRKILFINSLTNVVTLLIVLFGSYHYRESYLDIAFIYVGVSFVAMKGFLVSLLAKHKDKN